MKLPTLKCTRCKHKWIPRTEKEKWVVWQRLDWDWWVVTKDGFNPIPFFEKSRGVITKEFLKTAWRLGKKKKIQTYSNFTEYVIYPKKTNKKI